MTEELQPQLGQTNADPNQQVTDPNATATPQPTYEELLTQYQESQATVASQKSELERKEGVIQRMTGIAKKSISKDEFAAQITGLQEWMADSLDAIERRVSGEEEPAPAKKTHRQQLEEKKAAAPAPAKDPDVDRFFDYISQQGMGGIDPVTQQFVNPDVREAIGSDRTPAEALEFIRGKVEAKAKAAQEKALEEKVRLGVEQVIKDKGYTAPGAGAPNASAGKTFTESGIRAMSTEEFKENEAAIEEAQRMGRILKK